jgi:hypothetical protein
MPSVRHESAARQGSPRHVRALIWACSDVVDMYLDSGLQVDVDLAGLYVKLGLALLGR